MFVEQGRVTTAMEASLAALAVVAIAASIWTLIISCKAINCCTEVSVSQVCLFTSPLNSDSLGLQHKIGLLG